MNGFPEEAGSYALHLVLDYPQCFQVGRLGKYDFPAGEYLYLGSAHGPGGLRARLEWHLRQEKTRHWHIDFLLACARLIGLCWSVSPARLECSWSQILARLPAALIPVPGFGASDCRRNGGTCRAHLLAFPSGTSALWICSTLAEASVTNPINLIYTTWQDAGGAVAPLG